MLACECVRMRERLWMFGCVRGGGGARAGVSVMCLLNAATHVRRGAAAAANERETTQMTGRRWIREYVVRPRPCRTLVCGCECGAFGRWVMVGPVVGGGTSNRVERSHNKTTKGSRIRPQRCFLFPFSLSLSLSLSRCPDTPRSTFLGAKRQRCKHKSANTSPVWKCEGGRGDDEREVTRTNQTQKNRTNPE